MKAVILLGGVSSWLYPLSQESPRAMLEVGDRPALGHLLANLSRQGVSTFVVPLSPELACVERHFGDGGRWGLDIRYVGEKGSAGTGGSLRLAAPLLRDEPFLIVNGNSYLRLDLGRLPEAGRVRRPFLVAGTQ